MDLIIVAFVWVFVIMILFLHGVLGQIERLVAAYQSLVGRNVLPRGLETDPSGRREIC